jgi:hypothetical protein
VLIILIHFSVLACIPDAQEPAVNRGIGSLLQIIGASVVLWCIAQNLGFLKGKSFFEVIKEAFDGWVKRYPNRKPIFLEVDSAHHSSSCSLDAIIVKNKNYDTLKDKVEYLMKRSKELEIMIYNANDLLTKKIEDVCTEAKQETKTLNDDVNSLKSTLNNAVLGGVKVEISGFLIASYGVVISGFWS